MATLRKRVGDGNRRDGEDLGYQDCTFVEQPPGHIQTDCPVCKSLLRDPSQVTCCGNLMCAACFKNISGTSKKCPMCRNSLTVGFSDINHKRIVEGFRVYCCYRREGGGGCEWIGQLGGVEQHLNSKPVDTNRMTGCAFVPVKCSFCQQKVARSSLDLHEKSICPQRKAKCPYCNYVNTYVNVSGEHKQTCPHIPVPCQFCGNRIRKSDMNSHVSQTCPEVPTLCEYGLFGCEGEILRKNMANHMVNSQVTHLKLVKERVVRLQQFVLLAIVAVVAVFVLVFLYRSLF
ncbi:TNF receptor-associated factor 6 [Geodia barretti]|uniref:TNF receptor-associated factor 6 n=1 Tax=Geodia barretti TaxID=519541 RepID=A0AA35XFJ3_GEOBA|nr:TNF receptor-associated factor 6 [Geodia barretti]